MIIGWIISNISYFQYSPWEVEGNPAIYVGGRYSDYLVCFLFFQDLFFKGHLRCFIIIIKDKKNTLYSKLFVTL